MKVKVTLKFRGREMAHTEVGFQVVQKFLSDISGFGHPDFQPKLNGRAINLMISPLPRNKRAKHPQHGESSAAPPAKVESNHQPVPVVRPARNAEVKLEGSFANSPFAQLEIKQ
jgi:translation initiation factor IF-3